jgi:hypothetical protein
MGMSESAFTVVEPNGTQSAQLLDVHVSVEEVIASLLQIFQLPEELHYRLLHQSSHRPLHRRQSLSAEGISPGDVLELEVVRDALLDKFLDRLLKEAREYARDQLWDRVQEDLDRIQNLEPRYPGAAELRRMVGQAPVPLSSPVVVPIQPMPTSVPTATSSSGVGGCFLVLLVSTGILAAANSSWVKKQWNTLMRSEVKGAEGKITAGAAGRIEIVDHNTILDFAYQLYVNGRYVGDVRNPAGGTTAFSAAFVTGENLVELRYLEDNGARDTKLVIRINGGEFSREFEDGGSGPRQSFQWMLEGVGR